MNTSFAVLPTLRPRWVGMRVILAAVLIWAAARYSDASQIGCPFPGFFYTPDRLVSGFTPKYCPGWQAGLRPKDRIVAVNR